MNRNINVRVSIYDSNNKNEVGVNCKCGLYLLVDKKDAKNTTKVQCPRCRHINYLDA